MGRETEKLIYRLSSFIACLTRGILYTCCCRKRCWWRAQYFKAYTIIMKTLNPHTEACLARKVEYRDLGENCVDDRLCISRQMLVFSFSHQLPLEKKCNYCKYLCFGVRLASSSLYLFFVFHSNVLNLVVWLYCMAISWHEIKVLFIGLLGIKPDSENVNRAQVLVSLWNNLRMRSWKREF